MKKNTNYMQTIYACFIGYIVQAIVNNFVPLLFVTFQNNYHISLERITFLITLNFIIQLFVDLLSAFFVDRIGYRISTTIYLWLIPLTSSKELSILLLKLLECR